MVILENCHDPVLCAKLLGRSVCSVRNYMSRHGILTYSDRGRPRKYTDEMIERIIDDYQAGMTQRAIDDKYNLPPGTAGYLIRKEWSVRI